MPMQCRVSPRRWPLLFVSRAELAQQPVLFNEKLNMKGRLRLYELLGWVSLK